MTQSLNIVLPSFHRVSKKETKTIVRPQFKSQPLQFKVSSTHGRATSVPSVLPSHQQKLKEQKLSLNVLLDAIDIDQQLRQYFKVEVMKSKNRTANHVVQPFTMMARRRSKSAPGAPPSYHHQRAFNSRWIIPHSDRTVTSDSDAQQLAQSIVKKHIESVKKRD